MKLTQQILTLSAAKTALANIQDGQIADDFKVVLKQALTNTDSDDYFFGAPSTSMDDSAYNPFADDTSYDGEHVYDSNYYDSYGDKETGDSDSPPALQNPFRTLATAKGMLSAMTGAHYQDTKDFIKQYGCYCYPRGSKTTGPLNNYNGPALDPLDDLCRQYWLAAKCLQIDAQNGLFGDKTVCSSDNRFQWYNLGNTVFCGDISKPNYENKAPCKWANCKLEMEFAKRAAKLYTDPIYKKRREWSKMDAQEYELACPSQVPVKNGIIDFQCCGVGLERRSFNGLMKQCCPSMSGVFKPKAIGSC